MNESVVDNLKRQLKDKQLEVEMLNSVNSELCEELDKFKVECRRLSDKCGNMENQLRIQSVHISVLKSDIAQIEPGYDFDKLLPAACDLDMAAFGDRLMLINRKSEKPQEWKAIKENSAAVFRNCIDRRNNLQQEIESAFGGIAHGLMPDLLTVLEKSAAQLIQEGKL